jgi:hypothetical protein
VGGVALDQGVSAIVLVSDHDPADADPNALPTLQRRLVASRVPVFTVPVGNVNEAIVTQIVSLSGGARLAAGDPTTPAKIASLIAPLIPKWVGGAYRLRYQAPVAGPSQRTVTIGLAGRAQPVGSATYQVPDKPVPPPSFVGLYVTIEVQGGLTSFRRLVGAEGEAWPRLSRVLDLAAVALAAEQVGGAARVLETAVDYAKLRHQFGRPIGSFQALQHRMVDMVIEYEQAKSIALLACSAVDTEHDAAARSRTSKR